MNARVTFVLLFAAALLAGSAVRASERETTIEDALQRIPSDWIVMRTPSVRVVAPPARRPTAADLQRLEATVQQLCTRLEVPPRVRASLLRWPIEYVLTPDTEIIDQITGMDAEGAAFAERRLILATELPHEHELVHVVLHLAIGTRWSGHVSFLEEGLASAIGGHAGEGPRAVMVTADEVLARQPVALDRLFTEAGFDNAPLSAHERYAVAARFVDHLLQARGGWPKLRELLTILVGERSEIRRRPLRATLLQLEGVYDTRFEILEAEFLAWVRAHPAVSGMREAVPARPPDVSARDARHELRFWREGSEWVLELGARWGTLAAQIAWGDDVTRSNGWSAAQPHAHRYELDVDRTGAWLRDQETGRLLLRWSAADDPLRNVARLRIDPTSLGLTEPETWTVWSRPEVPSYR